MSTNWIYGLCLLGFYSAYKAYLLINAGEVRQRPREDHNGHYVDDQDPLTQSNNPGGFFPYGWILHLYLSILFLLRFACLDVLVKIGDQTPTYHVAFYPSMGLGQ